jgi:transcription initiation factor TFIID subunit 13
MSAQPLSKRHDFSKDREWRAAWPPRLPDLRTLTCPRCPYLAPSPAAAGRHSCSARVDAVAVSAIMYAYGDKKDQLPESLELMNAIVVEYMEGMTKEAMASSSNAELSIHSLRFAIRKDRRKDDRVKHLLDMFKEVVENRDMHLNDDTADKRGKRKADDEAGGPAVKKPAAAKPAAARPSAAGKAPAKAAASGAAPKKPAPKSKVSNVVDQMLASQQLANLGSNLGGGSSSSQDNS